MPDRWVVVDDTSGDVNYVGSSWFAETGSQDAAGNYGPPYLSTLHGTNTTASLTLNFSGSAVRVKGMNSIRNDSGVVDPQWSCYVDGVAIDSTSPRPFAYIENNWQFCHSYALVDGPHTITVNATVAKSQTFWFDRIEYIPSTSVSLSNKTIMLSSPDPAMQFGTGWNAYAEIGNWTQTQGSMFALNFYGTSLSWYGHIPTEMNGNATTASWTIDNNSPQVFFLKGHASGDVTAYNQKFFDTSIYSPGPHILIVTYNGDSSKTPLVLGYLVVQNTTAATSTTGISVSSTTSTTAAAATTDSTTQTPAIVGGVIGSLACLLIVVLLVLYRRRREANEDFDIVVHEPINYIAEPQVAVNFSDRPSRLPAKALGGHSGSSIRHPTRLA